MSRFLSNTFQESDYLSPLHPYTKGYPPRPRPPPPPSHTHTHTPLNALTKYNFNFSCSYCSCTIFILLSYSLHTQVMLILILINVQYLQIVVFNLDKGLNYQKHSTFRFPSTHETMPLPQQNLSLLPLQ